MPALRAWLWSIGTIWLGCGCAASPPTDVAHADSAFESEVTLEPVSTVPEPLPDAPPRPPRPAPTVSPKSPTPVPRACLDYLAKLKVCFQGTAPGAQDALGPVLDGIADQWRDMVQNDPKAAATLAETCEIVLNSLASSSTCLPPGLGPLPSGGPPLVPLPSP